MGLKTFIFYLTTTFIAVLTGIILVNIISPGKNITVIRSEFPDTDYSIIQTPTSGGSILKFHLYNERLHANINSQNHQIELIDQKIFALIDSDGAINDNSIPILKWINESGKKIEPQLTGTGLRIKTREKKLDYAKILSNFIPRNIFRSMAEENIFPLILFSLFFGAVLTTVGETGKPLIQIFHAINITIIKCVMLLMYIAPVGIFGLIAGRIGEAELTMEGGFIAELLKLAKYSATVITGLLIHGCITLALILAFFGKRNPVKFFKNLIPQILTAFSTGSSMATLPVAISLVTEKNKVSERIANFVLPIGATVNMDGTALYEGVAAIFIAQLYNIHLGPLDQLIILLTATIAAIGAAAIPQAGLVTIVLVLRSVDLPLEGIGAILSIDWFLDRCRTTVNSWGDVVGAAVIDRYEGTSEENS
ncbi:MAG TPA: dicarboxylate/amino acid:cation symporter [bacterium]|nr:dicarboxylate/amino acid:cation symporter [bacterium]